MSTRDRTAVALLPYLSLPPELSLTLVTGTLTCSATWLIARLIASVLRKDGEQIGHGDGILLVSWMRSETFWRDQLKRIGAIETRQPVLRYGFVDRLSEALQTSSTNTIAELHGIEERILATARKQTEQAGTARVVVVLDGLDVLLATHASMDVPQLNAMIMRLRGDSIVHSVILSCVADSPLLSSSSRISTPLESAHAAFISQQAHQARTIMSVRELATGSARDVSGIIRITKGGGFDHCVGDIDELEKRYFVQRDGNVKVIE